MLPAGLSHSGKRRGSGTAVLPALGRIVGHSEKAFQTAFPKHLPRLVQATEMTALWLHIGRQLDLGNGDSSQRSSGGPKRHLQDMIGLLCSSPPR
jgi:hypothetical protein